MIACSQKLAQKMSKHPKKSMKSRENQQLLACLFDSNCNCNSHTNHGVVTCADQTHHLYVGGDGGRACELSVAVHTAHGVGHAVRSGTCSHVIGMERSEEHTSELQSR